MKIKLLVPTGEDPAKSTAEATEKFLKKMYFLLYNACGRPMGMGVFQQRDNASEDDVWDNVKRSADYAMSNNKPGDIYADYVFGRMVKQGVEFDLENGVITLPSRKFDPEYQGFARAMHNNAAIVDATVKALGAKVEVLEPDEPAPAT